MEMQGLSPFRGKEPGEKPSSPVSNSGIVAPSPPQQSNPPLPTPDAARVPDTATFRQISPQQPPPRQAPLPQNPLPSQPVAFPFFNLSPILDRLATLAASFFKGNQRDLPDEDAQERWKQNELDKPDLFDLHAKVNDTHQADLGGGNR